jgi:glucuronokinase
MSTQTKPAIVGCEPFSFGRFVEYAIETRKAPFWGMRMPGAFFLVGQGAGLEEYRQMDSCFANPEGPNSEPRRVKTGAYARVGLMGNPSDGFNGKTISFTVKNFWASVELWESEHLRLLPHPLYDPSTFSGLEDLHFIGRREGYYGGTRLLMATCKRFQELCTTNGIALPRKNFTVKYDTNIPRQVGLAGSSAIVTSLFSALMQFYDLSVDDIPLEKQPSFVLSVESELGIQAGLQDRVVQVYRGLVFMDFAADYMSEHGHGDYQRLPEDVFDWLCTLPFFIAYEADPSDSGKIHSNVRSRWDAGDAEVIEGMKHFAQLTVQAKDALLRRDHSTLADLMDENFTTRRRIYGDACLGAKNLRMIEICKSLGAAAKFPGSGGAVLGLCRPRKPSELAPPSSLQQVREALESENFVFCPLDPVICPLEMI